MAFEFKTSFSKLHFFFSMKVILSRVSSISVRKRSGIIAHRGLSNAKPRIVDFILRLPGATLQLNVIPKSK